MTEIYFAFGLAAEKFGFFPERDWLVVWMFEFSKISSRVSAEFIATDENITRGFPEREIAVFPTVKFVRMTFHRKSSVSIKTAYKFSGYRCFSLGAVISEHTVITNSLAHTRPLLITIYNIHTFHSQIFSEQYNLTRETSIRPAKKKNT